MKFMGRAIVIQFQSLVSPNGFVYLFQHLCMRLADDWDFKILMFLSIVRMIIISISNAYGMIQ